MTLHLNPRTPLNLLTPAMRSVMDRIKRARRAPLHTLNADAARAAYEAGAGILEIPQPALSRIEDLQLPMRDGHLINARLYASSAEKLPVCMYFHGGGFNVGSLATHDTLCRQLSALAGCALVSVDYRLAPAHRFPTAVNDAWDALTWLAAHATDLGLDGKRLAVGGDSAGGTLAAVCAVMARDADVALCLQLLFYPGCTSHQDTASHRKFAHGFVLEETQISSFFNHYIRSAADRDDWRFAPLNAPDTDGVAPAWLGLAECDPLVDEGVLYADKLRASGVAVDLEIYRGVTHEFIKMGRVIPEARQAHAHAAGALKQAFEQRLTSGKK